MKTRYNINNYDCKRQIENGDGYASGGTVPQAIAGTPPKRSSPPNWGTVPLARNRPRALIDVYL